MSEADVVTSLYRELDRIERPMLHLVTDVVEAPAAPTILDAEVEITRRVYTSAYRALYGVDPAWPPEERLEA